LSEAEIEPFLKKRDTFDEITIYKEREKQKGDKKSDEIW